MKTKTKSSGVPMVTQLLTTIAPLNHMVLAPMAKEDPFVSVPWELHTTAAVPQNNRLGGVELHILCTWVRQVPRDKALEQVAGNKAGRSFVELGDIN